MPFRSEKQRRYLWKNDPEVAQKFADDTPKGTKLPMRVTPARKPARVPSARRSTR